jgi:DnaJ-class molecular chaperone
MYHPDKIVGVSKEEAEQKFAEISMAYETLKDPKLRDIYDRQGEEGLKNLGGGGGGTGNPLEDILRRYEILFVE